MLRPTLACRRDFRRTIDDANQPRRQVGYLDFTLRGDSRTRSKDSLLSRNANFSL
jgi:hypothetical protein